MHDRAREHAPAIAVAALGIMLVGLAGADSTALATRTARHVPRSTRSSAVTCCIFCSSRRRMAARSSFARRSPCSRSSGAGASCDLPRGGSAVPARQRRARRLAGRPDACARTREQCVCAALLLCVANPVTLTALRDGHPEDLLGRGAVRRRGARRHAQPAGLEWGAARACGCEQGVGDPRGRPGAARPARAAAARAADGGRGRRRAASAVRPRGRRLGWLCDRREVRVAECRRIL